MDGSLRFLLRDSDGKYGRAFDAVFLAEDLRVIKSAPQAPRMNAHCERVIGSIRILSLQRGDSYSELRDRPRLLDDQGGKLVMRQTPIPGLRTKIIAAP